MDMSWDFSLSMDGTVGAQEA